jgi:hypothetical protein
VESVTPDEVAEHAPPGKYPVTDKDVEEEDDPWLTP